MNKKLRILSAAALALALLAGCQGEISFQGDESVQPPSSTPPAPSPSFAGPAESFRPGTWQGEGLYYFFHEDGSAGSTASMENGTGVAFTYELDGETVTFHMGSADDSTPATLVQAGDAEIELNWADGRTETLSYVSGEDAETFSFYTNEELCDLAVDYYQSVNGGDDPLSASATINPDGTVFIQIAADEGDHLSNLAQYDNVDRLTAAGTDAMTGESVQLNFYGFDGIYRDAESWFRNQTSEYEVLTGEMCGSSVVLLTALREAQTGNYSFLQVFVLERRGDSYEITAWRDAQYGAPAGFTANVLATDELTVVFGDADTRPFTQATVIFEDGLTEIRTIGGFIPYLITLEGKKTVADVSFDMEGTEVKYSEYFDGNLMDDSASADIIPIQ